MKIGFIGAGNMAGAIVRGMVAGGVAGADVLVFDIDTAKLRALADECGVQTATDAAALVDAVDTVVLAVKPQVFATLLPELAPVVCRRAPLVISIAAGKTIASIEELLSDELPIVRVMPNINACVGASMSAFCGNAHVTDAHRAVVRRIFDSVGQSMELAEHLFSAYSALASCSPAYTLLYMDALAEAGVRYGIPKEQALAIASQAVLGTARLLQERGVHPRALVDQVCSPAGTTIEGVVALQENGFEAAVLAAARASMERDRQLGQPTASGKA